MRDCKLATTSASCSAGTRGRRRSRYIACGSADPTQWEAWDQWADLLDSTCRRTLQRADVRGLRDRRRRAGRDRHDQRRFPHAARLLRAHRRPAAGHRHVRRQDATFVVDGLLSRRVDRERFTAQVVVLRSRARAADRHIPIEPADRTRTRCSAVSNVSRARHRAGRNSAGDRRGPSPRTPTEDTTVAESCATGPSAGWASRDEEPRVTAPRCRPGPVAAGYTYLNRDGAWLDFESAPRPRRRRRRRRARAAARARRAARRQTSRSLPSSGVHGPAGIAVAPDGSIYFTTCPTRPT